MNSENTVIEEMWSHVRLLFTFQLELFRRDGIKATIFELGVPIETTIRNEKDSEVHRFHNAHR